MPEKYDCRNNSVLGGKTGCGEYGWHQRAEQNPDINKTQTNQNYCMKIAAIIARSLLGLLFVVFGLNIFLNFIPLPLPPEGPARNFMIALGVRHYFWVVGALEFIGGVLLLSGRYTPLGLTLLGPVIINILCVHIFLDPSGLPMAIIVAALASFLLYRYREHFVGLINPALSAPSRSATTGDAKS